MQDTTTLDQLLECLHELNCVEAHPPQSSGGLHDSLNAVREELRSEILSIVNAPGHRNDA